MSLWCPFKQQSAVT